MAKCPTCDYANDNLDSLRIHAQKRHKLSARDLYLQAFLNGVEPKCACGCGETPKFWTLQRGFAQYVLGHHSRVHNNWGHNEKALEKSHATTKARYDAGDIQVWNKGLTSETDERVAAYGEAQSANFTPERRRIRSERMTTYRLSKVIPDLTGSAHGSMEGWRLICPSAVSFLRLQRLDVSQAASVRFHVSGLRNQT